MGVGIGTSIVKARTALAGVISALFAPIALSVAKSAQKVVANAIGVIGQPAVLSLLTISTLRAIEYGILAWILASLAQKEVKRAAPYLTTGSAVGVIFGGTIAALGYYAAILNGQGMGAAQISAGLINEIVSPIGCALVIYLGTSVSRNLHVLSDQSAA